ncbi:hemolysin family protein [Magnetospirillum aberrantis]|uniref:HlyC/CorC family transporter n=1 Tax=Magnetospirillum aberrantis SpK TaxID=908842 RepID=A0A7C9QSH5_9PROT|nr:hemolysin family protein [Magnetospirillum aberrantis]NFV79445.1 HlyC/CorC family transporter [Magnetospirillum aberrantis SpK]
MWVEILIVLALILINGFFAMSELALVSSRPAELRRRAEKGSKGARVALEMLKDPSRLLSTVQIGITLVGIVAGAYSGATLGGHVAEALAALVPALAEWSEEMAMTGVVGAITYLSLVVGELVPKRLAMHHSETIAIRVAPFMRRVAMAGGPAVALLRVSTNLILRLLGQKPDDTRQLTEDELRAVIAEGALAGVIEPAEKEMLDRVMRLADRPVGSIMTPRPDVVWLDADDPLDVWRHRMTEAPHSRFPVARGSLDDMVGVLDTRRILGKLLAGEPFDPLSAVTPAPVVHEGIRAPRVLELFKQTNAPMLMVLDEYGGFEGIVTMTDFLEAVAGEMPGGIGDEPSAVRREDGSWLLDGMIAVEEAEAVLGLSGLGELGDYHTLAGFMLSHLAHLPLTGEYFVWSGWRFEVVDMDGRRIDRILATPPREVPDDSGS